MVKSFRLAVIGTIFSLFMLVACEGKRATPGVEYAYLSFTSVDSFRSEVPGWTGEFGNPLKVGFDPGGFLYVLDVMSAQVVKLDLDHAAVGVFGGYGQGPGELPFRPSDGMAGDIAVGPDRFVVYTGRGSNLHAYSLDGAYLWRRRLSPGYATRSIEISDEGLIIVSVYGGDHEVEVYSPDGDLLRTFGEPILPGVHPSWEHILMTNAALLPDDRLALFYPWFSCTRIYEHEEVAADRVLEWRVISGPDSARHLAMLDRNYEWALTGSESIGAFVRAHPIVTPELLEPLIAVQTGFASDGSHPWLAFARRLLRLDGEGRVDKVVIPDGPFPNWPTDLAIRDGRICIAVGFEARLVFGDF